MTADHTQPAEKIFETHRSPGFLFNALDKAYSARTTKCLKSLNLNAAHWPVLDQIYLNAGITQRELARLCLRDPSTLVSAIDALEKKGFVRREADVNDRRIYKLYVTEKGAETRQAAYQATHELFDTVTSNLSQEEIDRLYDTCLTIYVALQKIDQ